MTLIIKALTTRLGVALIVLAVGYAAHRVDKTISLRSARAGYVLQTELDVANAAIAVITRRAKATEAANENLTDKQKIAESRVADFETELERYETDTQVDGGCVVNDALFDLLR